MKELSQEERKRIAEQYLAEKAKENRDKEAEKARYKKNREKFVRTNFSKAQKLSNQLIELKNKMFEEAEGIINQKNTIFNVKDGRRSDTFTSETGDISIKMGYRVYDGWDDSAEIGVTMVEEYLQSLAKDEESSVLVQCIRQLLSQSKKGNLKANKVLELQKIASKVKNTRFVEGIQLIANAYRPLPSCTFVEIRYKDKNGKERSLPLSMSAMEVKENAE